MEMNRTHKKVSALTMDAAVAPPTYLIAGARYFCPVQLTVETLSGRWKPMILWHLVLHPSMRYSALKRSLVTVTHKMLAQSLRELEADGLIVRTVHNVVPPQVDYALSAKGEELRPLFHAMKAFGETYRETAS
jgi:DNA-binding HxlR family transcriptional regulator